MVEIEYEVAPEAPRCNLALSEPEAIRAGYWQDLSQRSCVLGLHHGLKTVYAAYLEQQYYNLGSQHLAH